ncbi:hypothetical protein TNCV_3393311 [Trichonephila clavipes]|nr:hypothetical protein TNCV_3393311 [Trichonephila clavipes]
MAQARKPDMDFTLITALYCLIRFHPLAGRLTAMKNYIRRLQIICNEKDKTVSLLRSGHGHDESTALSYRSPGTGSGHYRGTLQQAVRVILTLSLNVPTQAALISFPLVIPRFLLHLPLLQTVN